ncbi:MAG TPA: CBS domain-containing protein [Pseudorhodoplanes sp.]|nr:CBS domain-containing protein [Pseudorhodoplanes sp.]
MQARDLMVEGPNVVTVQADDSIYAAIRLMLKKGISGLPVVETGPLDTRKLVGMVTEGDFLRRRETKTLGRLPRWLEFLAGPGKLAEEYVRASSRKIGDIMTTPVITVTEETPVEEIVQIMEQRYIKRLPVVRGETLIGIITRTNMLRALVREAGKMMNLSPSDGAIRQRLLTELKQQPWGSAALIEVGVQDGVVKLTGTIWDARERSAIVVAAANTSGVRAVDDQMVVVDRVSGMAL